MWEIVGRDRNVDRENNMNKEKAGGLREERRRGGE